MATADNLADLTPHPKGFIGCRLQFLIISATFTQFYIYIYICITTFL